MSKVLLVLGASTDQLFMIKTAHSMGLQTVAVDGNPEAPGLNKATYSANIDFSRTDKVIDFVITLLKKNINVAGVSTMGSDVPHIIATIADHFGWSGPTQETASLATNKLAMKTRFRKKGVPVPNFTLIKNSSDIIKHWEKWKSNKIIIKPTNKAGSRGVRLITRPAEIEDAYNYTDAYVDNGEMILEEYIEGPQISTESLIFDDVCITPGFADREYEGMESFHPNIMENGGWQPSVIDHQNRETTLKLVEKASRALGIVRGVSKGDVVICPNRGPMIIEMAARLSGGDFAESLVPLGLGINYVEQVINIAIGNKFDTAKLIPCKNLTVANRYFFPPPGKLEGIKGFSKWRSLPQITKLDFNYSPGQIIPLMTCHGTRAGVFVVVGDSREDVIKIIESIYKSVLFKINGKYYSGDPCRLYQ